MFTTMPATKTTAIRSAVQGRRCPVGLRPPVHPWRPDIPPRLHSDFLKEDLRRLKAFDLETTESAKTLLIDALFAEIVPNYERLKV